MSELQQEVYSQARQLAAQARKIAALREALTLANQFLHPGNVELGVQMKIDAALSASPVPDPASVPPWERKAPCPCGAPIGAGCIREKEAGFRGCWILGGPMPPAPDPAEAGWKRAGQSAQRMQNCEWTEVTQMSYPHGEDPAEAMRAKCEAIAHNPREHYPDKESLSFAEGYRYAMGSIAREIAALKGNGEGL